MFSFFGTLIFTFLLSEAYSQGHAYAGRALNSTSTTTEIVSLTSILPSSTPTAGYTSVNIDLSDNFTNEKLDVPELDTPATLNCKNCSTTGSLTIGRVDFNYTDTFIDSVASSIVDFFEGDFSDAFEDVANLASKLLAAGVVELDLKGFSAYVELEASVGSSDQMTVPLFHKDRSPFKSNIPNITDVLYGTVSAALDFGISLVFAWQSTGGIDMTYGFNVTVPDSTVSIDVANFNGSVTGLRDATINALPFQANSSNIDVQSITLGLVSYIDLALAFNELSIVARANLDLPQLDATFSNLSTTDYGTDCEQASASASSQTALQSQVSNLLNIVPSVNINASAEFAYQLGSSHNYSTSAALMTGISSPIQTACLAYATDKGTSGSGTASASFVPAATAVAENAGSSVRRAPSVKGSLDWETGFSLGHLCPLILVVVAGCFAILL